MFIHCLNFTK